MSALGLSLFPACVTSSALLTIAGGAITFCHPNTTPPPPKVVACSGNPLHSVSDQTMQEKNHLSRDQLYSPLEGAIEPFHVLGAEPAAEIGPWFCNYFDFGLIWGLVWCLWDLIILVSCIENSIRRWVLFV